MSPTEISADTNCRRVFCVDADPTVQRALLVGLAQPGWGIECACDASDALERLAADARSFEVLVMDHQMPDMTGLELAARSRALGYDGEVIVIAAALADSEAAAYRRMRVGAIFMKPLDVAAVRAALARRGPSDRADRF